METLSIVTESTWIPENQLLITHISGDVSLEDVERWEQTLNSALQQIPDNTLFKILVNLHGFTAINIEAHKRFRTIIPITLAQYNWKAGYVNLFEEEAQKLELHSIRGIRCVAAAHVHQDATKMERYESNFSHEKEHYFTDPDEAKAWIDRVPVS